MITKETDCIWKPVQRNTQEKQTLTENTLKLHCSQGKKHFTRITPTHINTHTPTYTQTHKQFEILKLASERHSCPSVWINSSLWCIFIP